MIKALCLAAIIDMGLFFHTNKLEDLIKCETELLSSINDIKVKVLCCYNKSDFDMLIGYLMQGNLLKAHDNKVINISL
jgi:hypothetical protein